MLCSAQINNHQSRSDPAQEVQGRTEEEAHGEGQERVAGIQEPPGTRNKKQPALRPTRREGCPHPREVNPSHPRLNYIVHIEK